MAPWLPSLRASVSGVTAVSKGKAHGRGAPAEGLARVSGSHAVHRKGRSADLPVTVLEAGVSGVDSRVSLPGSSTQSLPC